MFELNIEPARSRFLTAYPQMLDHMAQQRVVMRLWERDPGLWHPSAETQRNIAAQLGWLTLPATITTTAAAVEAQQQDFRAAAHAPLWIAPNAAGHIARLWSGLGAPDQPPLPILDSIEPATVRAALAARNLAKTPLILAGDQLTVALRTLAATLAARAPRVAATIVAPPTAPLATYRPPNAQWSTRLLPTPSDVGLRWGALSAYGLLPAALAGLDLSKICAAAQRMEAACRAPDPRDNPGLQLGALLGTLAQAGHDKLTLVATPELAPVAHWIEAFVAGSLSKHGRGFVPITDEPPAAPDLYRHDRVFVVLCAPDQHDFVQPRLRALQEAGHPVVFCTLAEPEDVAALIVCWQVAVAIVAVIVGVNPFDEPDSVGFERELARRVVQGRTAQATRTLTLNDQQIRAALALLGRGSWIALASYLPRQPGVAAQLAALREALRARFGCAVLLVEPLQAAYAVQLLHAGRGDGAVLALSAPDAPGAPLHEGGWSVAEVAHERWMLDLAAWLRMGRLAVPLPTGQAVVDDLRRWVEMITRHG